VTTSIYTVGDKVLVCTLKGGSKVAIPIAAIVKKYNFSINFYMRFTGLTPGATSQMRFKAKRTGDVPSGLETFFNYGPEWHYTQAYDSHYSSEAWCNSNTSDISNNSLTTVETPTFICPNGGGITVAILFLGIDISTISPLPIYITDVQILVDAIWTDVPDHDFSAGQWNTTGYGYDDPMGDYWNKIEYYYATGIYQAESGVGLRVSYSGP